MGRGQGESGSPGDTAFSRSQSWQRDPVLAVAAKIVSAYQADDPSVTHKEAEQALQTLEATEGQLQFDYSCKNRRAKTLFGREIQDQCRQMDLQLTQNEHGDASSVTVRGKLGQLVIFSNWWEELTTRLESDGLATVTD